jgi:hypothetical protein
MTNTTKGDMDANIITTLGTGIAILTGVYAIVNRSEDRINRSMNQRFDDAKDVWRAELRRVEEVLDARLKHLEER